MTDIYTQYELVQPRVDGVAHRIGFMTPEMVKAALADGWQVHAHWPVTKLVREDDTGKLKELRV